MKSVYDVIMSRRSIREFTDEPVPREYIEKIVEAALNAPSARNGQSWQFTVITDKKRIEELAAVVRKALERDESYNFYAPTALIMASNCRDNSNGIADCACALENIFLMATELGVGSVWINQLKTICDETEVREELTSLGVPADHIVWGMAAMGMPKSTEVKPKALKGKVVYVK